MHIVFCSCKSLIFEEILPRDLVIKGCSAKRGRQLAA